MGSLRKKNVAKIESPYVQQQEEKEYTFEKNKRGLIRRLSFYGVCAIIFSAITVFTLISQATALEKKTAQKEELLQDLSELKKDETLLKEDIVKLNDDDYIAKLARRDYFLSEEGEIIFSLPENTDEND